MVLTRNIGINFPSLGGQWILGYWSPWIHDAEFAQFDATVALAALALACIFWPHLVNLTYCLSTKATAAEWETFSEVLENTAPLQTDVRVSGIGHFRASDSAGSHDILNRGDGPRGIDSSLCGMRRGLSQWHPVRCRELRLPVPRFSDAMRRWQGGGMIIWSYDPKW